MQAKNKSLKQKFIAFITVIALVALTLSVFAFSRVNDVKAASSDGAFMRKSISVTNGDFTDVISGGTVTEPSSWNVEEQSNDGHGSTVHGVIDLDTKSLNNSERLKDYKLDKVDEFQNIGGRVTPFGTGEEGKFPDTDTNALFLNSGSANTFYGYTSASISLSANSYYEISAWVKTGNFGSGDNNGATVKVTGLKNPLAFSNINTIAYNNTDKNSEANDYGWVKYSFYIETSTMYGSTINIGLELGSYTEYTAKDGEVIPSKQTAKGYVFFDNITAAELSATQFEQGVKNVNIECEFDARMGDTDRNYFLNDSGNVMLYSENDSEFLSIASDGTILHEGDVDYKANEIGSFDNEDKGWELLKPSQAPSTMVVRALNGSSEKDLGIADMRPYSPDGENNNIAVLTSYNSQKEKFESTTMGYTTAEFIVPKMTNYRLSVWVNTYNGSVASAAVYGNDYRGEATTGPMLGQPQNRVVSDLVGGDSSNDSHNGWREIAFYLKGSYYTDYRVGFEIWLGKKTLDDSVSGGYKAENVSGVAMFDNVKIEEISIGEFNSYAGDSTKFVYDYTPDTNDIVNYDFRDVEDGFKKGTLPSPSSWKLMAAGEDNTAGMSDKIQNANYRDIVHTGVLSSSDTEYTYVRPNDTAITQPVNTQYTSDNSRLLMIKSDESTGNNDPNGIAVGYGSSAFSVASDRVQKVDVTLLAENIQGYGANIVVKNGDNVIAAIEGIRDTYGYKTYSVYVDTNGKTSNNVYVEVWLGLYDNKQNASKLSKGTIFIDKVELNDAEDGFDTETKVNEYERRFAAKDSTLNFAVYSAADSAFAMFNHNESGFLKIPYNWDLSSTYSDADDKDEEPVKFGIFDGTDGTAEELKTYFPNGYKPGKKVVDNEGTLEDANPYSLIVFNKNPASSRVKSRYSYQLQSGSYYTITVYAKVDIPASQKAYTPDYKGAYIGITDTDYFCSDVKSTASVTDIFAPETDDNSNFQKFTIYVHTAGNASDETTTSINLEFGIGGTARTEWAVGSLVINEISVVKEDDSGATFEYAKAALENGSAINKKFNVIADYSIGDETEDGEEGDGDTDEKPNPSTGDNWYIYITIILAVVVVIAIAAFAVRYFAKKRKRDNTDPNIKASYDRAKTLVKQVNAREEVGSIDQYLNTYDQFDEDEEERFAAMKEDAEFEAIESETEANETTEATDGETEASEVSEAIEEESPAAETAEKSEAEETEAKEETENGETADETAETEEPAEEEYQYDEEIVDFTPSVEQKRILAEKKAEAERIKAEKEAEAKRKEEERAKAEAERRAATRRNNNWDDFED